jgi:hypothetical protein
MTDFWSDEKVEELKQLVENGLSGTEIGNTIGATKGAIIGKATRLGLRLKGAPGDNKRKFEPAREGAGVEIPGPPGQKREHEEGVPLMELGENGCRYAIGETAQRHLFCGEPRYTSPKTKLRSAYCEEHHKLAYYRYSREET